MTTVKGEIQIPRFDNTEIEKFEEDFYKPTSKLSNFFHGDTISMVFQNNGKVKGSFQKVNATPLTYGKSAHLFYLLKMIFRQF